ncbi:MAG: hypothetical protein MSH49_05280 [[Eubacterium] saphenum]|nr:hypothetical protein [[Eubacterium] saphenum]
MSFIDTLIDKGIKVYNVASIPKTSIEIEDFDELCRILSDFNIDHVYLVKHYIDLENMIISNEQLDSLCLSEEEVELLSDEIGAYNSLCQKVDYSIPITGELVFTIPEEKLGFYYTDFANDSFVENGLFVEPLDALKSIIESHDGWIEEIKSHRLSQIESEKAFLKHALIEEDEFKYCKNKSARYIFLMRMLDEKYGIQCPKLVSRFKKRPNGKDEAQAFVDCLWEEYKNSGFKAIY